MEKFPSATREHMYHRYKAAYRCSDKEAEELYEYDTNYCNSDEDAKDYLLNVLNLPKKKVKDLFVKKPAKSLKPAVITVPKEVTKQTRVDQADRMKFIGQQLVAEYGFLFGKIISETDALIEFQLPDGGGLAVKIAKHKTPKVVTKEIKRRVAHDREGGVITLDLTDNEYRCMAVENVLRERPDLFVALSVAGSQFGFVTYNAKYPFGSVKLTHHKG